MNFQIPGKTFLVGEYSVLLGGSALGLATEPCFELNYGEAENPFIFHPESPAGRYLAKYRREVAVSIQDPYPGGFGKSTAEYLAVLIPDLLKSDLSFHKILKEYKELHSGSGIDLAFQYFGQVCLADPAIHFFQSMDWHFAHLDFFILSTGFKVNTHEHIQGLDLKKLKNLPPLSDKITRTYSENKEFEFLGLMKEWCQALEQHDLTHPHSMTMRQHLQSCEFIQLAKPCGALGADVMIVFFTQNHKNSVAEFLTENKYQIQAHAGDLHPGLRSQLQNPKSKGVIHVD